MSQPMIVDVSVEHGTSDDGGSCYAITLSSSIFELNIRVPVAELGALERAATTDWSTGALAVGESAGSSVFWCAGDAGIVTIMVGEDDETWDFSVDVPADIVRVILDEAAKLSQART